MTQASDFSRPRFLLGLEPRDLDLADPTRTVLEYLRLDERRRGTKEGCAEGDCGACTVTLGECGPDGSVRYRAVNACIQFAATLDGKQLVTVEDLADGDHLHPVQQALVDAHGSQCGFCTPGFVMSLYAGHESDLAAGTVPDRQDINDRLAGNLCRCTGYRPIVEAALNAAGQAAPAQADRLRQAAADALPGLARTETLAVAADGRRYFAPATLDQATGLLAEWPDATLLAGGTDVGLWVTKLHKRLDTVIYLGDIAELKRVEERGDHWWIGAGATYNQALAAFAGLHPDFAELVRRIGSVQIRNAGTLGGNIGNASPIGDSMPALIALGARLHLRRGAAARSLPIEDYFLGYRRTALQPGELIVGVEIPKLTGAQRFATYKVSKRFDQDISAVCPAYRLTLDDRGMITEARIAHGGMAAIPARAPKAEAALTGQAWTAETVALAAAALAEDYAPIDDMRASGGYRLKVAQNLLRRFHLATTAPATRVQVLDKEVAA